MQDFNVLVVVQKKVHVGAERFRCPPSFFGEEGRRIFDTPFQTLTKFDRRCDGAPDFGRDLRNNAPHSSKSSAAVRGCARM